MFSNRFNNTKNDPLVEAVQNAMQDGEIRRQAVAYVNEAFGVYNRNAVVREDLAEYDAAIEDVYYFMKEAPDTGESDARKTVTSSKEAKEKVFAKHKERMKKLDDKPKADYSKMREKMVGKGKDLETTRKIVGEGNDGNLANNYPPYDKVTRGDVIAGATGKDQMGGKKKKMEEEQIDEISKKLALKAMKKSDERGEEEYDRDMTDDRLSDPKTHWDRAKRLRGHMKRKFGNKTIKTGGTDNLSPKSYEQGGGERRRADKLKKGPRAGMISARHRDKLKDNIKYSLGKHKKPNLPEEVDYSAPDRAAVTRDNKPSTPAQTNAATSGPSAADKAALASKIRTMKEAIGTSQYGTATGPSFGAIDRARNAPSRTAGVPRPTARPDQTSLNRMSASRGLADSGSKYAGGRPHSSSTFASTAPGAQAKVQSSKTERGWADPGKYENEVKAKTGSMQQIRQGKVQEPSTQLGTPKGGESSTQSFLSKQLGKTTANPQGPEASSPQTPQQRWDASRQASNQPSPGVAARTASAEVASGADKARDNSASVKKLMAMNESVQVGANRYRIV